ncbi:MAG: hypothetical protein DRP83_05160 [Planctomycetota bacterium]|nr:MAG: hypothetical protein DRP83_05160 [Planctomycetota bacterium]
MDYCCLLLYKMTAGRFSEATTQAVGHSDVQVFCPRQARRSRYRPLWENRQKDAATRNVDNCTRPLRAGQVG